MRPPYNPKEWEEVCCPYCGSSDKKLYDKFGDRLQYTYVACLNCTLIYHSPRPKYDQDFLDAAYKKYFIFNPDYEYTADTLYQFKDEIEEIVRFDTMRKSILDIGSAMGNFMKLAIPHYDKVVGVEISEEMASFTEKKLGVSIIRKQLEDIDQNEKYSCIHMSHVLEHIPNPNEWMQKAKNLLENEGILVICVPNINSIGRKIKLFLKKIGLRDGRWKESWRTPDHLFEPSISSMKYLCEKNGFKIISYYTYSRKDPISRKPLSRITQRKLKIGSNLRFYLKDTNHS